VSSFLTAHQYIQEATLSQITARCAQYNKCPENCM